MSNDDFSESEPVEIKAGEEWLVVTCRNPACQKTLLLEPVVPEILTDDGEVVLPIGNLEVICLVADQYFPITLTKFELRRDSNSTERFVLLLAVVRMAVSAR